MPLWRCQFCHCICAPNPTPLFTRVKGLAPARAVCVLSVVHEIRLGWVSAAASGASITLRRVNDTVISVRPPARRACRFGDTAWRHASVTERSLQLSQRLRLDSPLGLIMAPHIMTPHTNCANCARARSCDPSCGHAAGRPVFWQMWTTCPCWLTQTATVHVVSTVHVQADTAETTSTCIHDSTANSRHRRAQGVRGHAARRRLPVRPALAKLQSQRCICYNAQYPNRYTSSYD